MWDVVKTMDMGMVIGVAGEEGGMCIVAGLGGLADELEMACFCLIPSEW